MNQALSRVWSELTRLWSDEAGQDLVEYSLLLAFIALAAVALLGSVRTSISVIWGKLNNSFSSASSTGS